MEYIIGFLIFAAIAYAIALRIFPHTITWKEILVGVAIQTAVIATVFYTGVYSKGHDIQILNGRVVNKTMDRVSCGHSYSCNCISSCNKSGCTTTCQTCYEHSFDIDWNVRSTVGSITIPRIDRQGLKEPPRYTSVQVGEFFAKESSYFNYIKASPLTIFDKNLLNNDTQIPSYLTVHDHYRLNRVSNYRSQYNNGFHTLNEYLNESLKTLGSKKKVNVYVLFHGENKEFVDTLKAKLYGGKINDVVVAIKASKEGELDSVDVFSWSRNDLVNIKIRDAILDMKTIGDMKLLSDIITVNIEKEYVPRSVEEFQYLKSNIRPSDTIIWVLWIFGLAFPFIWGYIAHRHLDL